jgi:branched-chain amino acid transport system substrate-binding protein
MTMKRLAAAVLVVALLGGASVAFASARGTYKGLQVVGVVVNGQELKPDVPAVVMDDRTLLPVRAVAEAQS